MARIVLIIAALVTLGVAAGVAVPALKKSVTCAFYDCPSGYTLIDDTDEEECKNGKCETSKCCDDKVCSSYDCPKYYELVDDADDIVCEDYKCTKYKCCQTDYVCCDSYHCPEHYSLKEDPDEIKCPNSGCTTFKCCNYHRSDKL